VEECSVTQSEEGGGASFERLARRQGLKISVLLFALLFLVFCTIGFLALQLSVEARRTEAEALADDHLARLNAELHDTMGAAYMLGSVVKERQGQVDQKLLESLGPDLLRLFPMASAVQFAPKGVIRYTYPVKDNKEAIGHDLLSDRNRNKEAHLALATQKLTLAGPFPLVQGGVAAVGRYPVFINNADGWPYFWGFSTVLIRVPRLLEAAGMMELERADYRYGLCRVKDGGECEGFASHGAGPPADPVRSKMVVPNGQWILSLAPNAGWRSATEQSVIVLLSFLLALVLALLHFRALGRLTRVQLLLQESEDEL
jgi:sensor domain CHASE-containing protein